MWLYDSNQSSEEAGFVNSGSTTLMTTSRALIQLCLTPSVKCSGPKALSKNPTKTTAKFWKQNRLCFPEKDQLFLVENDTYTKMGSLDAVPDVTLAELLQFCYQRFRLVERIRHHANGSHYVHGVSLGPTNTKIRTHSREVHCRRSLR